MLKYKKMSDYMIYYKVGSLKNRFKEQNPEIKPDLIKKFFSEKNLLENYSVNTFYIVDKIKSAFINEDDSSRLCLLATLKFGGVFELKDIKSLNVSYSLKSFNAYNIEDLKRNLIEHYKNPVFVEKIRKEKEILNSKKIHNQLFSKDIDNYNIDINNKKIVAIDFEFNPIISNNNYDLKYCSECGISILENEKVTAYHFSIEDGFHKYGNSKDLINKFEFGETEVIKSQDLIVLLKNIMKDADYLLCHGMETEYTIITKNGIDISINNTKVLDTLRMFKKFDPDEKLNSYRLKDIVRVYGMNDSNLHNAGNDAAYTLKTFLEMNKNNSDLLLKVKELALLYDKTKTKRKTFKI